MVIYFVDENMVGFGSSYHFEHIVFYVGFVHM
jgi:hypothetical protein